MLATRFFLQADRAWSMASLDSLIASDSS